MSKDRFKLTSRRKSFVLEILAFSDVHVDIGQAGIGDEYLEEITRFLRSFGEVDIVICAGDVTPFLVDFEDTLKYLHENLEASHYFVVPGNHDIWIDALVSPPDARPERRWPENITGSQNFLGWSMNKYEEALAQAARRAHFHYLPSHPQFIDEFDLGIIGNMGWYDYSLKNPTFDEKLKKLKVNYESKWLPGVGTCNDVNFANWGMSDLEVVEYLMKQLQNDKTALLKMSNTPPLHLMAVFHFVPFREGVSYKNDLSWDFFSAFMGSKRFGDYLVTKGFTSVIHGHTHHPLRYEVGRGIKVHCQPIGYPSEWTEGTDVHAVLSQRIKRISIPRIKL